MNNSPYFHSISDLIKNELLSLFLGKEIGGGMSRRVFEIKRDETKIIKIENTMGHFQNVIEWQTWEALKNTPHAKWLAPCYEISPCGTVLIMAKTSPLNLGRPQKLPSWITDHKAENFGYLNKKIVCHDYGTNLLLNHASKAMRRWEGD